MPLAYQKKDFFICISFNKVIFAILNKTLKHVIHENVLIWINKFYNKNGKR